MARLVDADALEEKGVEFSDTNIYIPIESVWEAPTIDAVEVVRCKDCTNTCAGNHGLVCTIWGGGTDPDGWCNHGERRTNEAQL